MHRIVGCIAAFHHCPSGLRIKSAMTEEAHRYQIGLCIHFHIVFVIIALKQVTKGATLMNEAASIIGLVIMAVSMFMLMVTVTGFVIWKLRQYTSGVKDRKRA